MRTWLDVLWERMRLEGHERLDPPDRGYPAYHNTCTNQKTPHPWSAVLGATERIQKVFNLPALRDNVMRLMWKK